MPMKNPPHLGRSVRENCLEPLGLSVTEAYVGAYAADASPLKCLFLCNRELMRKAGTA